MAAALDTEAIQYVSPGPPSAAPLVVRVTTLAPDAERAIQRVRDALASQVALDREAFSDFVRR